LNSFKNIPSEVVVGAPLPAAPFPFSHACYYRLALLLRLPMLWFDVAPVAKQNRKVHPLGLFVHGSS
jgi:hypothetical protein